VTFLVAIPDTIPLVLSWAGRDEAQGLRLPLRTLARAYRSPEPLRTTVFGDGWGISGPSTSANGFALCHPKTTRDETLRRYSNSVSHRLPSVRTVKPRALLTRLLAGTVTNVAFSDAQKLLVALGFNELRVRGSHHVYGRPAFPSSSTFRTAAGRQSLTSSGSWLLWSGATI
jgi:predicted RNA binding protein YcfA (HicA-like mRNA interferase family)